MHHTYRQEGINCLAQGPTEFVEELGLDPQSPKPQATDFIIQPL